MSPALPREQSQVLINFIIAHDVLVWAGVILAIIGLIFLLTRNGYGSVNIEDVVVVLICALGLVGATLGRDPRQILGITDAGTIALTVEIFALLLSALLLRMKVERE